MSQDVTLPSLLSTSNGVHYLSFCLNHLQYLFICFVLSPCYFHHSPPCPYFKCLKSPNIFFCRVHVSLPYNATLQTNVFTIRFFEWKLRDPRIRSLSCWKLLFPKQFAFLHHYNFYSLRSPNFRGNKIVSLFSDSVHWHSIFIVLPSTVDILMILVFFVLNLMLYTSLVYPAVHP